jgi:hypothetical protein
MADDLRKTLETAAKAAAAKAAGQTLRVMDRVNQKLGVMPDQGELHTRPDVAEIAGIGEKNPERLTHDQIRSLCGDVMRHVERMKAGR